MGIFLEIFIAGTMLELFKHNLGIIRINENSM